MNPSKAKQTRWVIIGALFLLGLLYAGIAEAKKKQEEPKLVFYVESFKPLNTIPYGVYRIIPSPTPTLAAKTNNGQRVLRSAAKPTENPKPQAPQTDERSYGTGAIQSLIIQYSAKYGIAPDAPLCIAKLESGFNRNSKNKSSSASGVFQYISGTWRATDEGKAGLSVFDAEANIRAAVKYMSSRGNAKPWTVHTKCPPVTRIK